MVTMNMDVLVPYLWDNMQNVRRDVFLKMDLFVNLNKDSLVIQLVNIWRVYEFDETILVRNNRENNTTCH